MFTVNFSQINKEIYKYSEFFNSFDEKTSLNVQCKIPNDIVELSDFELFLSNYNYLLMSEFPDEVLTKISKNKEMFYFLTKNFTGKIKEHLLNKRFDLNLAYTFNKYLALYCGYNDSIIENLDKYIDKSINYCFVFEYFDSPKLYEFLKINEYNLNENISLRLARNGFNKTFELLLNEIKNNERKKFKKIDLIEACSYKDDNLKIIENIFAHFSNEDKITDDFIFLISKKLIEKNFKKNLNFLFDNFKKMNIYIPERILLLCAKHNNLEFFEKNINSYILTLPNESITFCDVLLECINVAIEHENFEIVDFLLDKKIQPMPDALCYCMKVKNLKYFNIVFKKINSEDFYYRQDVIKDILNELIKNNCYDFYENIDDIFKKPTLENLYYAIKMRNIDFIREFKHLITNPFSFNPDIYKNIFCEIGLCEINIIQYLNDCGIYPDDDSLLTAVIGQKYENVVFLLETYNYYIADSILIHARNGQCPLIKDLISEKKLKN